MAGKVRYVNAYADGNLGRDWQSRIQANNAAKWGNPTPRVYLLRVTMKERG